MSRNICTLTDSYKIGHPSMFPDKTENSYEYFSSRKGALYNKTLLFGPQYLIKKNLLGKVLTKEKIDLADNFCMQHFNQDVFKRKRWDHMLEKHGGILPIRIKAVPEGTLIPTDNVLITMEATDEDFYWLSGHLDPLMTHAWSSSTVATLSREVKIVCKHYLEKTSDTLDPLDFMLHDFGFRGASCVEEAQVQGLGHLVNFKGTDTLVAIELGMEYYNSGVCAYSVPATEHSIMTSLGPDGEEQVLRYLLKRFPTGILSVVIDSFNHERFITKIAANCKDEILARDGKVVFRPDSGEPVSTTLQILELVEHVFGSSQNGKQNTVLNPKTGVLWGDGIKYIGVRNILHAMKNANFSAENIVFGMGGGLHSSTNRDTQRFAFKSSAQKREGVWHDIFKQPTEISKASLKGKQYVYHIEGSHGSDYVTTNVKNDNHIDVLETVLEDGELFRDMTFDEVRKNAAI